MAKFQYATKEGKLKTFDADNSVAAQQMIGGFSDAAPKTGVMAVLDNPGAAVITKTGAIDVSQVPASDVKPFEETKTGVSVVKTTNNADGTSTQVLSDGTSQTGKFTTDGAGNRTFAATDTPPAQFATYSSDPDTALGQLSRNATTIQSEITAIEQKMANRPAERNAGYDAAGVFDDMRQLNDLKAELRSAQDRSLEIPIESRQRLRGRQATKTEFDQDTKPALENAALRELSASRASARLTDTIKTNMAIVDTQIEAETAADEFMYTQKQKRLDNVTTVYGNIMTEKQKAAAEQAQFQNSLILENMKTTNGLRADLIKGIAEKGIGGAQLQGIMTASVDELLQFSASISGSQNWATMTTEQAAQTLSSDEFTKFKAYKELQAKDQEAVNAGIATQQSAKDVITTIQDMLNDSEGLQNSVGFGLGNMDIQLFGIGNESAKFRANAKKLTSQATLEQLTKLKASGATLGAISEKELAILQNASTALGGIVDKNGNQTGRFEMSETDFKTALETMRMASMKTFIAASIGKDAYARAGYMNADFNTINTRYTDLITNPPQAQDYSQTDFAPANIQAATSTIKAEEGLRTQAYQDTTGTWTIGFGNTTINGRPVQPGDSLSVAQADALLQNQIVNKYTTFADAVSRPVTPSQFAALTSFEYNLGSGVWDQPTGQQILALVDSGNNSAAGRLMLQYNKSYNPATGQLEVNPTLAKRRAREASLLLA